MTVLDVFNIWDQAQMTGLTRAAVERVLNQQNRVADIFAPREPTRADKIAKGKLKLKAVGKARGAIADDATPPIYRPEIRFTEEAWSMLRLGEMTPVEESLRRALENNGTDEDSRDRRWRAGADIITRARALQLRQENLSDYYVMTAIINGELPVKFANPPQPGDSMQEYTIDYEYPAGHLALVSTSFADLVNANPITVLRAYQSLLRADSGDWGVNFYLSSEVWDLIIGSKQVKDSLTVNVGAQLIPVEQHVKNLMYEPSRVNFNLIDDGWYEETAEYNVDLDNTKTRWIPKDRIIVTTGTQKDGEPLAQMFDGMVPVQTDWNDYQYRGPGAQSYVQLIPGNLTLMWRQEARRMPMINHPECILSAKVVL